MIRYESDAKESDGPDREEVNLDDGGVQCCENLEKIVIPDSVTRIGEDVFEGFSEDLTIHGAAGSRAESYAAEYGINFAADLVS